MSERILKLVTEARQYAWENETHWSANAEREALFEQKFAELLIKECAIIANRAENTETELRCMYDVITEHFGIE